MKIRNGFVSNSSSSSFIIKNIAARKDYFRDYPIMSSMTEFAKDDIWNEKATKLEQKENKSAEEQEYLDKRDIYSISLRGGHKYSVQEIYNIIKKYGHEAKCLESYEEDWEDYLKDYDCVIMNISNIKSEQAESIMKISWGREYIWNKCEYSEIPMYYADEQFNVEALKRGLSYTESPMFRIFLNTPGTNEKLKKLAEARKAWNDEIMTYYKECDKCKKENREEPSFPELPKLCYSSIDSVFCAWCRQNKGNICYNVKEAIDSGDIYVYAKENYLFDCVDEIMETCQCIMFAPHMG